MPSSTSTFQFTHPRGVRRILPFPQCQGTSGFNSRTHAGCDIRRGIILHPRSRVSIHAPTRGATPHIYYLMPHNQFQFTHPRGVRHPLSSLYISIGMFQFTHPRGVRLILPTVEIYNHIMFQFTHPRGVRLLSVSITQIYGQFQFTHPRGVRRTLLGFLIINELSNIICEVNNFIPNFKYIFQYY